MPVWPHPRPPPNSYAEHLAWLWFWAVVGGGRAGSYPTARADRWPPGTHAITRTRKLSRSGTRMCHPGGGLTADLGTILLRAPPQRNPHINSVRATVPYVPSVQPSMVVLTTADPPISNWSPSTHPLCPQNTTVTKASLYSSICIPLSQGCLGHQTASEPSAPPTKVDITNNHPLQR